MTGTGERWRCWAQIGARRIGGAGASWKVLKWYEEVLTTEGAERDERRAEWVGGDREGRSGSIRRRDDGH